VRYFFVPILAVLSFGRTPSRSEILDLQQTVKLESSIPCDGVTNPQQEIILDAHFSPEGWQRIFVIDNYQDESCKVDAGMKCFKHVPAGWRDDLTIDSDGTRHFWLNSCRTWGSKEAAQYTLSGWYKEGPANKKKLPWKQAPLKQVSTQPEVYAFADPNGGKASVEIRRR